MISKLSERIAVGLKQSSIIEEDDVELYAYGFYILISKLLFLIIALILGVILNIVFESIVFYVSFSIIRAYAGGVHANREWKCFLYTSISIVMCALGIKIMNKIEPTTFFVSMLIISSVIIVVFSPLDTKEIATKNSWLSYQKTQRNVDTFELNISENEKKSILSNCLNVLSKSDIDRIPKSMLRKKNLRRKPVRDIKACLKGFMPRQSVRQNSRISISNSSMSFISPFKSPEQMKTPEDRFHPRLFVNITI